MGQFSWHYSDTGRQMVDNKYADSFLLVPPPFQHIYGKAIHTPCYDGYGNFGPYDVYDLVAEWNRDYLSEDMLRKKDIKLENFGGLYDFEKRELREQGLSEDEIAAKDLAQKQYYYERAIKCHNYSISQLNDYRNGLSDEEMEDKYGDNWKREIGIDIACYDEQNAKLPYPIKITSKLMEYDEVSPSLSDPNQGWED